jgi:GTP-binding protein LepA
VNEILRAKWAFSFAGLKVFATCEWVTPSRWPKKALKRPLSGFQKIKPMVFAGIFPVESPDFKELEVALEKLGFNDSSLSFEVETSAALGFGFRCGFLGLLHMEIVQERFEREFNLNLITTAPTVVYQIYDNKGVMKELENPSDLPDPTMIDRVEEPIVKITLHTPSEYIGGILKLCEAKRGVQVSMDYISDNKVVIVYNLPMSEMVIDFYDKLKTISRGYASMEYEITELSGRPTW